MLSARVLLIVLLAGALLALPVRHTVAQDFPPKPGATPIVITLNLTPQPPAPPPAPAKQQSSAARARAIVAADNYVHGLAAKRQYTLGAPKPWKTHGQIVTVNFRGTATITGTWLKHGRHSYRHTYRHVFGLRVYVDLSRGRVDSIEPIRRT